MFNIGPGEFLVLAIVAVIVLGPERLPGLARDAARLLRTLRDLATGARTQLQEELGPEFADLDLSELRNLNPRTALQRAILGEEDGGLRKELRDADPRALTRGLWQETSGSPAPGPSDSGAAPVRPVDGSGSTARVDTAGVDLTKSAPAEVPYDSDAT